MDGIVGRCAWSAGTEGERFPGRRAAGILCGCAVVALFSGFTLVSRLGLSSPLGPPDLMALRFGVGGLLLLPVVLRHGLSGLAWREAAAITVLGGLGFALLAYGGFALAPAAQGAVLLHGTLPLFTFLIVAATSQARAHRDRLSGIALIAVGVAVMAASDSVAGASARQLAGDGLLLLAALFWSAYGVVVQRLQLAPVRAAAVVTVLSMFLFLPVYAALPGKGLPVAGWRDILLQIVFQGVLIGTVSILVYTRAVALLGAPGTALLTAAVPCVTTLAAVPLLSESPSAGAICGVIVVTVGMLVAAGRALVPRTPKGTAAEATERGRP
jgi:drug/metabolite transporter (DMT)-like permease